jgi:hypothetical protein
MKVSKLFQSKQTEILIPCEQPSHGIVMDSLAANGSMVLPD